MCGGASAFRQASDVGADHVDDRRESFEFSAGLGVIDQRVPSDKCEPASDTLPRPGLEHDVIQRNRIMLFIFL
jgi:hypothetical protein